jgi:GH25 family lysozyme M1 (1,4-beta-N-acetylmuramidase)
MDVDMTIFGWDASDFDWGRGPMDVAAAAAAGISWFTHKATERTDITHAHYGEAMRRARDAGIPILGAYHVVRSPRNAAAEVDFCLNYVTAQTPWWRDHPGWFWQVDLETWPYDPVPAGEGEDFADVIEARTGRRAVIYASKGQYGDQLAGTSHELWNANYGTDAAGDFRTVYAGRGGDAGAGWVRYSGRMPIFWQYSSRATIGRQPTCDANAYRGSLDQLRALITGQGAGMDLDYTDANFGNAKESIYSAYRVVAHALLTGEDPIGNLWWLGKPASSPNLLWQLLRRIDTNVAADLAEDRATTVALKALVDQVNVAGGSVDAAPILAAIAAARAEESAAVTALHDQVADLTRRLTAAEQAAAAALAQS